MKYLWNVTLNKCFRKKLIISIIKDYIIMQMYHNNFDRIILYTETDVMNNIFHSDYRKSVESNGWHFDDIINFTVNDGFSFYNESYGKYNITSKQVEKALYELIADRFLMRSNPNKNRILFADKGLAHHVNEKSFEFDCRLNRKQSFAVVIAILSFIASAISIIISNWSK